MSKFFSSMMGLYFLALIVCSPLRAQTVEDILAKMIEAQGGATALLAVKDCARYGEVRFQNGTSGLISAFWKVPDKYRQEIQVDTQLFVTLFNGDSGWIINPRNPRGQKISGKTLKSRDRDMLPLAAICEPAKHGLAFELKGRESALGKDCYVLEMAIASIWAGRDISSPGSANTRPEIPGWKSETSMAGYSNSPSAEIHQY